MSLGDAMMLGQQWEEAAQKRKLEEQRESAKLNANVGDFWFRYDDRAHTSVSVDVNGNESYYTYTEVEITRFVVVRVTPCGVQLAGARYSAKRPRLQLHRSRKRFACATEALALESYVARKAKQASVYEARAKIAKECSQKARQGRVKYVNDPTKIPLTSDLSW